MSRTKTIQNYMANKVSIRISTAMQSPLFSDMKEETFKRACRLAGYSTANSRISRRYTELEESCFRCECERLGIKTALGKLVLRLGSYLGRTFK